MSGPTEHRTLDLTEPKDVFDPRMTDTLYPFELRVQWMLMLERKRAAAIDADIVACEALRAEAVELGETEQVTLIYAELDYRRSIGVSAPRPSRPSRRRWRTGSRSTDELTPR